MIFTDGLSSVTQCLMIGSSGRLRDTSIRSMSRTLLSLGLVIPNFNLKNSPRISIVFTDYN